MARLPEQYSAFLASLAEHLDIPDHLYEDAVIRYEDVADWLTEEGSPLQRKEPAVYPQGSFRLGTVVRPITEVDQYDIDLVCRLAIDKPNTTQADLKAMVGGRLRKREDLEKRLKESRRCWCLNYEQHFHMDVLPCVPNAERRPSGILLTDTDLVRWQKSNPIAYADWFRERMRVVFTRKRIQLAEARGASVEEVPEWQVRTPLQRVVQILKRHRDMHFQKDLENRPVSIIITTLAAKAYANQEDLSESLGSVLEGMVSGIEQENGRYVVRNPVEPDENFADKWNEKPSRRLAFFAWLEKAKRDFLSMAQGKRLTEAAEQLAPAVGAGVAQQAAQSLGLQPRIHAVVLPPAVTVHSPGLGAAFHAQAATWPERLSGRAKVHGSVYLENRRRKLGDLSDRTLPKRVALKFTLTTSVPAPYEVRWQVVNTGEEAQAARQLRGGFEGGEGNTHWESTLYAGTHWIKGFVLKDGVCVAMSEPVFVRIRK